MHLLHTSVGRRLLSPYQTRDWNCDWIGI